MKYILIPIFRVLWALLILFWQILVGIATLIIYILWNLRLPSGESITDWFEIKDNPIYNAWDALGHKFAGTIPVLYKTVVHWALKLPVSDGNTGN